MAGESVVRVVGKLEQWVCPSCGGEEFKIWKPVEPRVLANFAARAICVHCLSWTELREEQGSEGG
jgi:hypothetical protein